MGAMRSQVPPTLSVTIRPAVASPPRSKPGITNSDKVKSLPGTPRRPPPDFIRLRNMSNLVACRGAPVSGLCKAGRARDGLPGPLGRALRPTWTFEVRKAVALMLDLTQQPQRRPRSMAFVRAIAVAHRLPCQASCRCHGVVLFVRWRACRRRRPRCSLDTSLGGYPPPA